MKMKAKAGRHGREGDVRKKMTHLTVITELHQPKSLSPKTLDRKSLNSRL